MYIRRLWFAIRAVVVAAAWSMSTGDVNAAAQKPNVLFIAIDDQNDWIGCMGGHPLAQTPRLDKLAQRGTLFLNAHCQAPLCNPSRTSLLLSMRPTTSGVYGLQPWFRTVDELAGRVSLPQHFARNGYRTYSTGKIWHPGMKPAERKNEFDVWGNAGGVGVKPAKKLIPPTPMGDVGAMDWGVFPHRDEDKGDYQAASWGIEKLAAMPKDQPFFLAVGFALPHVPCYITERWFDLYPDSDKLLPAIREDDRADVPPFAWYLHWYLPEPRLKWVRENNQWRNLCRSYLASTSFIDAQIGRLLDALKANDQEQNTIVVVWSDHGWHLGEKAITGKNTLWERSTRVPLIFAGPGVNAGKCTQPAELLDIYPTLIELCGLPSRDDLDGHSLGAQLHDAQAPRSWPAITTHNPGNTTVRSERYRYIRYADGSEEFYDLQTDPHEWTNLIGQSQLESLLAEHRRWLPKADHPFVPGSAVRTLSYDAATGQVVWEGKPVVKNTPVPE